MTAAALSFITLSAFLQACYSALIKRSGNKTVFLWLMVLISAVLLTAGVLLAPQGPPPPQGRILALGAAGGLFFVLYHLCTGRAYREEDLSIVYPLSQTAILWAPLWGMLLFREQVSPGGMGGVLLILLGAWCLQMRQLSATELVRPLESLTSPGVRWALLAGLVYSFGSIVDKLGVRDYSAFWFSYLLILFMCLFMTVNVLRRPHRDAIWSEWRRSGPAAVAAGVIMIGSFVAFRYGLQQSSISYAVPVRQTSVIIAVLIGVLLLGESCGRVRMFSAGLILAGVACIKLL